VFILHERGAALWPASGWDERASGAARDLIPETIFLR
jgi:hypothetical protein